ncbi:fasciclin domain-containing protein [Filimonas effusa]|uniref:Fasciclin domain-containing protein n=1 Tax=Filimonas effusa TaxID=2508721 RepID=A0A4Q1DCQ5_9BACT|nr:fasciclin domain-containing protein [Filimonas effusa]RXK86413.1 fasciclin domain-containing protein [Filimonas effusa]
MKRVKSIYIHLLSAGLIMLSLNSCSKDDDNTLPINTLETLVAQDSSLSIFNAVLKETGLITFAQGPGPFTFFAPSNTAYKKYGINSVADVKLVNIDTLRVNTTWLIAAGSRTSDALIGSGLTISTQVGSSIFAQAYNNDVYFNGLKAVKKDISASNGTMFVLDSYMAPTVGSTSVTLGRYSGNPFKLFLQAATRASLTSTSTGINKTTTTLFAPTNTAMLAAGYDSVTISKTAVATLANLVKYHTIGAVNFRFALQSAAYKTDQGNAVTLNMSAATPTVTGRTNTAQIISFDQPTNNGVIHAIDKVLIP